MVVLLVLGGIGVATLATLWSGFVLSVLWGWFIAGVFGLPHLGVAQAIGIALISELLTHQMSTKDEDIGQKFAFEFIAPLVLLIVGWVVKSVI